MNTPITQRRPLAPALLIGASLVSGTVLSLAHASDARSQRASATVVQQTQVALASPEQLAAAERVLVGQYDCEFGQRVSIDHHQAHPGYFNLKHGKQSWVMKPVLSQTGAIRLEDVRGTALLIQILTKSMLLDPRKGQRLVDGCMHEVQRAAERDLASRPRQSILGGQ